MGQKGEPREPREPREQEAVEGATPRVEDVHPLPEAPGEAAALAPVDLDEEPLPTAPVAAAGPWRSYKEILAGLAQRVLDAQRPIRILQTLRWESDVEEQFLRSKQRELPKITYAPDLGFDPEAKLRELDALLHDAERDLGKDDR